MANCVTCGRELHPERAEKYNYCTDPDCQKKNAKGLTILALGVNKAADHLQVLDEKTRERVASGSWVEEAHSGRDLAAKQPSRPAPRRRSRTPAPRPTSDDARRRATPRRWTKAQQDLALLYNQQGMRPDRIAEKLRLSTWTVTQMLLEGRDRTKL
jgi:hypothetical protein